MEDILPSEFYLSQNYPNPFKESTIIKYCVPDRTKIKLEVFNSPGESVALLVDEIKSAGTYQVEFSAEEIPGGDYFYRLEAVQFIETKRMTFSK